MRKLFIIIPAFNEEGNIIKLLTDIKDLDLPAAKKIIVIDDGSLDKTRELVEGFKEKLDLQIIIHEKNLGVPQTFFDGLKAAAKDAENSDAIVIIEGDNTSDLKLIPEIIQEIENGADLVVASRYAKGGRYKNFPFQRTVGSYLVNAVIKLFFYTKGVTDYTIFYRGYKAEIIKKALEKYGEKFITTKSFAANLEVLLRVREFSKEFREVPLVYDYGLKKGKSKMKVFKTLMEYKDLIFRRIFGKL